MNVHFVQNKMQKILLPLRTKLTETDLAYFQFEFLMLLAKIFNFNIHNGKSGWFGSVHVEDYFGPGILFIFAVVLADGVLGLPPVSDLHVIPGHEGYCISQLNKVTCTGK